MRSVEITLVGESGAGKTSLLRQFAVGTFSSSEPQTIGIDCRRKTVLLDRGDGSGEEQIRVTAWDTAGLSRFREMALRYVPNKLCVLLVCSVASAESFAKLDEWKARVLQADPQARLAVVATQVDRKPRVVQRQALDEWCGRDIPLFEATATDHDVAEGMFLRLLDTMLSRAGCTPTARDDSGSSASSSAKAKKKKKKKGGSQQQQQLKKPLLREESDAATAVQDDDDECCCCYGGRCTVL